MAGITGWFGGREQDASLASMAANLDRSQLSSGYISAITDGNGVAASAGHAMADVAADVVADVADRDGILAVIQGRPRWDDSDLSKLAEQSGFAASVATAYDRHGPDFLQRLKGWFSVAVYNTRGHHGVVAIDRMGIGALVYGRAGDGAFVFGSTTDAVRDYPGIQATVAPQALFNFLYTYMVPAPTTIYSEFKKLLPAQMIRLSDGMAETRFYWAMPYTKDSHGDMSALSGQLLDVLKAGFARTVAGTHASDVGAFLSGGLDSSTVSGLMALHYAGQSGDSKTFTIAFNEAAYDESRYARIAAEHFKTDYHQFIPTPDDVLALAPKIAEVYDEPYGNTSAVPAYYCAKMAREHGVKVMLAGDGGDEIFGGNERYTTMQRISRYGDIPAGLRTWFLEPILNLPGVGALPVLSKARNLARRYAIPMPDRIYSYGAFAGSSAADVFLPDLAAAVDADAPMEVLREAYNRPDGADTLQRMMHLDLKATLADNDLRKVNRMCALAGVEVRFPFLDDGVVEFAASLPSDILMPGAKLRHFYKVAMADFLPQEIITKEKHGFGLPFEVWVKQHKGLQDMVRDNIAAIRKRDYFQPKFLDQVMATVGDSQRSALDGVAWDLSMLELWLNSHRAG